MSTSRPWWASEGPIEGGVDPGEDPIVAHRTARRGGGNPDPADGGDPTGHADHPTGHDERSGTEAGDEICAVCPVCIAARRLGESRPELLASLTEAGRHLAATLRTLLETPSERRGDHDPAPDDGGVRRIDLD